MKVEVKLFARARDVAGAETVCVEVSDSAKVADLRAALVQKVPELEPLVSSLLVAVGNEYADDQTVLDTSNEIACFPPVSGG